MKIEKSKLLVMLGDLAAFYSGYAFAEAEDEEIDLLKKIIESVKNGDAIEVGEETE